MQERFSIALIERLERVRQLSLLQQTFDVDEKVLLTSSYDDSPLRELTQRPKNRLQDVITVRLQNGITYWVPVPTRNRTTYELVQLFSRFLHQITWKANMPYPGIKRELVHLLVFNTSLTLKNLFIQFD